VPNEVLPRYPIPASPSAARAGRAPQSSRRLAGASTRAASFDDLVGADEDRWRHGEAECFGSFEIDDQLEPGRPLDRQIGRLGALEDLSDINSGLATGSREACSIADQAAGRDVFTILIDRRNGIA